MTEPANNENFEEAYTIFYIIFDAVPLLVNEISVRYILRAQPNAPNELFTQQSRISYNKNLEKIPAGKFNAWNQSMFYGCLPYETKAKSDFLPTELTASLECCKELDDRNKNLLLQDITIGKWSIRTNFSVINLCFDDEHLNLNFSLKESNSEYIRVINEVYSADASEFIISLFKYYSELCSISSDESAYYILTALYAAITNYYDNELNMNVNGLISPSAMTDRKGLNIVMTPEAVDEFLLLNKIWMIRYYLIGPKNETYAVYPCTEKIENWQNRKDFDFQFGKYIEPAPRFLDSGKRKHQSN